MALIVRALAPTRYAFHAHAVARIGKPRMQSHFTPLDWTVLIVYFAGTMSIGFYFCGKSRSTESFTAAGGSLPGWVVGLSIFATYLSSISYLALPGKSYAEDWNPFVFSLAIPVATWIAVRWFLPYYRASGEVSAYALLEHRFGLWARIYASVFYLLTQIARMGIVMYLMALPMAVIFGWDIRIIIICTGLSVTLYSFVGGIIAVIWADAIQAMVLLAGAVICLIVMWLGIDGGPATVLEVAGAEGKFSLGELGLNMQAGIVSFDFAQATILVVLLYGLFINLQNFGIDQSYVQRYIASSSDREARKSLWLGGILYIPVSAIFFMIGTTLFVYYHSDAHGQERAEIRQLVARQRLMQQSVYPEYDAQDTERVQRLLPGAAGRGGCQSEGRRDRGSRVSSFHCPAPAARTDRIADRRHFRRSHEHRVDQPQLVRHIADE